MLVALTGASGFIGSYTAHALHRGGHKVRALVRESSRRDHIESCVSEWCVGNQSNLEALRSLVGGAEAVIHCAADWAALYRSPEDNFEQNVLSALRLLEEARLAGVRQFLFVSSVAVYHHVLHDRTLDENHPTWPSSIYGAYKVAVESHIKAYHLGYGMNTSAWRPAAVYGVDPNLRRSQWYDLIDTVRRRGTVDTPKGGKITHVQDVADALASAVGDEAVAGQFFNLVDRHIYWQMVAELAGELTDPSATIIDRKGAGPRNQFDMTKASEFFARHHNPTALHRGLDGVREYITKLLQRM